MNFFKSFFFSLMLHSILGVIVFYSKTRHNKVSWYQISTIRGTVLLSQNKGSHSAKKEKKIQNLSRNSKSTFSEKTKHSKVKSKNLTKGNVAKEIGRIQNQISYPELALIQGWESNCEWRIVVGEGGFTKNISVVKPCHYSIFEKEFRRVIKEWRFDLPKDTVLNIPIEFVIDRY